MKLNKMHNKLLTIVLLLICLSLGCEPSGKVEEDTAQNTISETYDPREEPEGLYRTGFQFESQKALSYNKKALKLMDNKAYYDATNLLLKARKIEPKNPIILSNLGLAYMHQKDYKKSIKYQNEAISKSDSTAIIAFINLSNSYIETNAYSEAITLLNIVLKKTKDPQYVLAGNVNLILAHIGLKDCNAGEEQYVEMKKVPGADKYRHKMEDALVNCKLRSKNVSVESRTLTEDEVKRMYGQ